MRNRITVHCSPITSDDTNVLTKWNFKLVQPFALADSSLGSGAGPGSGWLPDVAVDGSPYVGNHHAGLDIGADIGYFFGSGLLALPAGLGPFAIAAADAAGQLCVGGRVNRLQCLGDVGADVRQ